MPKRNRFVVPGPLERTRRRFERWRETRKVRTRIPESLWDAAVKMAGRYGVCQTAKTLRVSYYALKERAQKEADCSGDTSPENDNEATFVEWAVPSRSDSAECVLEWEDAAGAKMRVHLKGLDAPDLVALSRSFWGVEP